MFTSQVAILAELVHSHPKRHLCGILGRQFRYAARVGLRGRSVDRRGWRDCALAGIWTANALNEEMLTRLSG